MSTSRIFRKPMLLQTFLLLTGTGCTFVMAQLLSAFLETVSASQAGICNRYLTGIAVVMAVELFVAFVNRRYIGGLRSIQTNQLECSIYAEYLKHPTGTDNESELSVVCDKDVPVVTGYYADVLPQTVQAVIGVLAYSVYIALEENGGVLLGILVVLSLFQYLPPLITEKYLIRNYIRAGEEEAKIQQQILSGLEGIHTIKMLGLEEWFMEQFLEKQQAFRKTGERAAATSSFQSALDSGLSLLQQVGVLLIGLVGVAWGWFSLGTLIKGYVLSASFYQYAACLGRFKASRGMYRAAMRRIRKLCAMPEVKPEQLHFGLEFDLPPDGCWLVKGENGSGKTTLLAILGGQRPSNERITQNGNELDAIERKTITSWCPQMYLGSSVSFKELVDMIPEGVLDRRILRAYLEEFAIAEKLKNKPLNRLSGGEQKKLILSLALARKAKIVLLDEPEVSLDEDSVIILSRMLQKDRRLILLVTHSPVFDEIALGTVTVRGGAVSVDE